MAVKCILTGQTPSVLDGVTENVQTQIDDKQSKITVNGILKGDGSGNITAASETEVELVSLPNICNPNLLDNWYFGNPVNQRDGKIIQQGVNIYIDSTLETLIGPAAYACPVVELTSTYAKVQETKNTSQYYYAAPGNVVQGYTVPGYGIDRWQILSSGLVLTISDGCITISNTEQGKGGTIIEKTEVKNTGSPVVMSVLLKNGTLFVTSGVPTTDANLVILKEGLYAGFRVSENNCLEALFYFSGMTVTQESIVAVKLELGSQQTLAHQENGVWVLNEIPNYGEQLRRCQRYFRKSVWSVATKQNGDHWSVAYDATNMRAITACTIEKLCYIGNYDRDPGENDYMITEPKYGSVMLYAYIPSQLSTLPDSTSCGIVFTLSADL